MLEHANADDQRSGKAEERGRVRFYAQNRQCSEKNNHGKGRDERRKPPVSQGIINLRPSHSRTSSTLVIASLCEIPAGPTPQVAFEKQECVAGTSARL